MTNHILPQADAIATSPPPDDFTQLVAEIAVDEALPPHLAASEACELEQSLISYAAIWDARIWSLGNLRTFT